MVIWLVNMNSVDQITSCVKSDMIFCQVKSEVHKSVYIKVLTSIGAYAEHVMFLILIPDSRSYTVYAIRQTRCKETRDRRIFAYEFN
jgi:hypothetical protein